MPIIVFGMISKTLKKNKLRVDFGFDFDLVGISTSMKEYKLAWFINNYSPCNFHKAEDIQIDFNDLKNITISNFLFETEHTILHLLKNRLVFNNVFCDQYLIPELKNIDFFLKIDGEKDLFDTGEFVNALRQVDQIQYIATIDPLNLKQKENLIF